MTLAEIIDQFRAAMRCAELDTDDAIQTDGKLHRVPAHGDKAGKRDLWYVLHADGIAAGRFGHWGRDIDEKWQADIGRSLTAAEQAGARARIEAAQRERDAELTKRRDEARKKAAQLWAKANSRASFKHPYLVKKQVRAYGLRQLKDGLVLPVRDIDGVLHGLQFIQPDSTKRFTSGMAKAGHYHAIGKPGTVLLIAEGYATGATLHEATGLPVAVAFDAGNLRAVAQALRTKFPAARIVIAADNDHRTTGNPGLAKARDAAQAVDGAVIAPEFAADAEGTDWNDYAALHGLPAVQAAFRDVIDAKARPPAADASAARAAPAAKARKPAGGSGGTRARFTVDDDGVWHNSVDPKDGTPLSPYWVCLRSM